MLKRTIGALLVLNICLLTSCAQNKLPENPTALPETVPPVVSEPEDTRPDPTQTEAPETIETEPVHSPLYLPGVAVDDVILYFNEVCLDSEFVNSGDPSYVQKWTEPIFYRMEGNCTDQDLATFHKLELWLNYVEGFPGIYPAGETEPSNLRICLCTQQEMVSLLGPNFEYMDGGVTFWYDYNEIYDGIICCRTDLDQQLRSSVLLEELYNGLGPIQDTRLRPDSIIYEEFSQNQWLSPVDEVILKLLYHPDILPGMDAQQCEQVIRRLYY